MKAMVLCLFFTGCIPPNYQMMEKNLDRMKKENNVLKDSIEVCEEQKNRLKKSLDQKPVQSIKPDELKEIKRKALSETERKFNSQMKKE